MMAMVVPKQFFLKSCDFSIILEVASSTQKPQVQVSLGLVPLYLGLPKEKLNDQTLNLYSYKPYFLVKSTRHSLKVVKVTLFV